MPHLDGELSNFADADGVVKIIWVQPLKVFAQGSVAV